MAEPESGTPALKERAGVVNALLDGSQTVLIRASHLEPCGYDGRFALYPGYSHQHLDRYSPRYEHYYHRSTTKPEAGIPIRAVASVVSEHPLDPTDLSSLAPHYAYSTAGLRDKYDLGDGDARLLVLRVERLDSPQLVAERSAYRGCRTWIELDPAVDLGTATPVLDDAAFAERAAAVRATLRADDDDTETPAPRGEVG